MRNRTMELDLALPAPRSAAGRPVGPAGAPGRGDGPPADGPVPPGRPGGTGRVRPAGDGLWPLECPGRGTPGGAARAGAAPGVTRAAGAPRGTTHRPGGGPALRSPVPAPPSRDALGLLRQAAEQLAEAHRESEPVRRYPAAYLAALRAGAAVLAMRARPRTRRGAPRDGWRLLAEVAPELEEWAVFFAGCSRLRTAAEAGIDRLVDQRAADDLLRQAEQFVTRVGELLPR
ncbi:SAV_6107 family HEPN domain-containing protein [Pseudonocardia spirodelae]|uniref:SAV_6107 family HEPN domain-containing protein n=1 Tax=Pseudonocardia spirodelae TaxID=3133431 RepID=A0ABU8TE40_9PSEU